MNNQKPVVLIIDDEVQIRRFLPARFEHEDFTVRDAASAAEGIRAATLKPTDIVVLDLGGLPTWTAPPDWASAIACEPIEQQGSGFVAFT
jgi:FixJ family two-component response regulator